MQQTLQTLFEHLDVLVNKCVPLEQFLISEIDTHWMPMHSAFCYIKATLIKLPLQTLFVFVITISNKKKTIMEYFKSTQTILIITTFLERYLS